MNIHIANELVQLFYKHAMIIKTFHFQTKSYAAHKASDNYLTSFNDTYDTFMELLQGILNKRINIKSMNVNITFKNDEEIITYLQSFSDQIYKNIYPNITHTSLLNVLDTMGEELAKFIYLLSFQ